MPLEGRARSAARLKLFPHIMSAYLAFSAPAATDRRIAWWIRLLGRFFGAFVYRVKALGVEHIPATGGALIVANHLSYADVIALQLACPRPLRFVGSSGLTASHGFFRWVFAVTGTIPVSAVQALQTTRVVAGHLAAGELVVIFAEGSISRTGQLMKLQRGFELMARRAGVPVVPVFHDGLWGSIFSYSGQRYIFKSPRLLPTPITVAWGASIAAEQADAGMLRQALLDLSARAFAARPFLERHIGREVVRALARHPSAPVVVDRTATRRALSAAQLLAAAAVLAARLRRTVAEERVGIALPPGAGAHIANLAALIARKTPVNLNYTAGRAAVEASLARAGIRTVLSADAVRAKLPEFPWPADTRDLGDELKAAGGKRAMFPWLFATWLLPNQWLATALRMPRRGGDQEAGLLFTSGSSGEPKGVVLTHRNLLANCEQISSLSILPAGAVFLGCLPIFHSFGFTITLWYPLLRGCQMVTVPSPLDTRRMIDALREEACTAMVAAPTFLRPVLKRAVPADLRHLRVLVTGAEKLLSDLYESSLEKFHLEVHQGYGLTETSPVLGVNQPDPPIVTQTGEHQRGGRFGSIGRLLPGVAARVMDAQTGAHLPLTATGVLHVKGANIFPGYLGEPAKSAAVLRDGWFETGDLARFDDDGFLYIEGRLSRFSKLGGEMVPHGTIEQKLIEVFGLVGAEGYPVFVTGVPDAQKGEALVLLTTLAEITAESVREKLAAAGLPNLWVPRTVRRVDLIPVLGTGKLDLKAARELALAAE
jgi:acyl-[acyl-carrier-protein]-phospholipid O-acyltransferase / long-chain-fatty-acid--[acyl-carrier-protein] ligase